MSAFGPKQTWSSAPHMSAFRGKADMTSCGKSAFAVAIGVKRTWLFALQMSAYDPKQTSLLDRHTGLPTISWVRNRVVKGNLWLKRVSNDGLPRLWQATSSATA